MIDTFGNWLPLSGLGVGRLPKYGDGSAVYAFRDRETGDILKYGRTDRFRRRIFGNFIGGVGGSTTQFVHAELFAHNWIGRVELAWLETVDKVEAEHKERQFRSEYKKVNGRRPIWDRQD